MAFLIGSVIASAVGYSYVPLVLTYRSDGASFTHLSGFDPSPIARGLLAAASILLFLGVNLVGAGRWERPKTSQFM